MKLSNQDLLEEFYEEIKEDYPDISFEQLKEICFGPWRFVKNEMESGNLSTIRLKYFGTFQVFEGRAKNMLYNTEKKYKETKEERYKKHIEMLKNYLEKQFGYKKEENEDI